MIWHFDLICRLTGLCLLGMLLSLWDHFASLSWPFFFVFLRHRNVFNKTFKREWWVEYILLENCSDFTSRLGLVYISMWVSCGGRFCAIVFVNLLGLCIKPYFSGCLKPHVWRAPCPMEWRWGAGAVCSYLLVCQGQVFGRREFYGTARFQFICPVTWEALQAIGPCLLGISGLLLCMSLYKVYLWKLPSDNTAFLYTGIIVIWKKKNYCGCGRKF